MSDPPTDIPVAQQQQVTRLLNDAQHGGMDAARQLFPLVYQQLRELARRRMAAERAEHTLEATALVHEAYVRLVGGEPIAWEGRQHFFLVAAEAMRRILIDHARARSGPRRGGDRRRVPLNNVLDLAAAADDNLPEILALDDAVSRLDKVSPTVAAVVRLRFYAGLSVEETADALQISPRTVKREWTYGRAWLARELGAFDQE
jgi:RNA polymerase sigma factor (TIGR02999 family)